MLDSDRNLYNKESWLDKSRKHWGCQALFLAKNAVMVPWSFVPGFGFFPLLLFRDCAPFFMLLDKLCLAGVVLTVGETDFFCPSSSLISITSALISGWSSLRCGSVSCLIAGLLSHSSSNLIAPWDSVPSTSKVHCMKYFESLYELLSNLLVHHCPPDLMYLVRRDLLSKVLLFLAQLCQPSQCPNIVDLILWIHDGS